MLTILVEAYESMQQDRVAHDIYIFTSELYAQVTAGLIATEEGCILIDTLPFPEETSSVAAAARSLASEGVQLLVLTHYHADHVYGAYQFPEATVVGHALTWDLLSQRGFKALAEAKSQVPELAEVELVLPTVVFDDGALMLHLGEKTLQLFHSPGHTADSIAVYVLEDKVLFAADTMLPVPTIFDGDLQALIKSLQRLRSLPVESVVQGHGEIILRGEVKERIDDAVGYLRKINQLVSQTVAKGRPKSSLLEISIESCGLSRIPLNGLVQQLHTTNLLTLYDRLANQQASRA